MRFFFVVFVLFLIVVGVAQNQKIQNDISEKRNQIIQTRTKQQAEEYKVYNLWISSIYKLRKNGYFVKNETYPHRAGIGRLYPIHIEHYDCEVLKPGDFTIKKNTLYTIRPFKTWKYDDVIRVAAEL